MSKLGNLRGFNKATIYKGVGTHRITGISGLAREAGNGY